MHPKKQQGCVSRPPAQSLSVLRALKTFPEKKWLRVEKQGCDLQRKIHRSSHQPGSQARVHVYSTRHGRRSCRSPQAGVCQFPVYGGRQRRVSQAVHPPVDFCSIREDSQTTGQSPRFTLSSCSVLPRFVCNLSRRRILVSSADWSWWEALSRIAWMSLLLLPSLAIRPWSLQPAQNQDIWPRERRRANLTGTHTSIWSRSFLSQQADLVHIPGNSLTTYCEMLITHQLLSETLGPPSKVSSTVPSPNNNSRQPLRDS